MKAIRQKEYDIVFWAHGHNETERFLPLMSGLKERGVKCLLFYQNYDSSDGLSEIHQKIISECGLEALDYSSFLKHPLALEAVNLIVRFFRQNGKLRFFCNKFRGLRSKLLQRYITEEFISGLVTSFKPKISFFDNITFAKDKPFPYGSYFIKKKSDELKIKTLSICHGGTTHIPKAKEQERLSVDFYKIYEPNSYEKEWDEKMYSSSDTKVLALGDPRFDANWKNKIKAMFESEIRSKIEKMNIENKLKILYLAPNLEQLGEETAKYRNLNDIVTLSTGLRNVALLIKPHPRYRNELKIRKIMARNSFKDFFILEDEPLVCYEEHVDYIVTLGTSALQDILPQGYKKVIIYDNFSESFGMKNIFRERFRYFDNFEDLHNFFHHKDKGDLKNNDNYDGVVSFCRKWVAAEGSLDSIINANRDDILLELHNN